MSKSDYVQLLNNSELGYLADLFLARYAFSDGARRRMFKNAIILAAFRTHDIDAVCGMIAELTATDSAYIKTELEAAIEDMPVPPHEIFNTHYGSGAHAPLTVSLTMDDNHDMDYVISFLASTFFYIVQSNYREVMDLSGISDL